MIEKQVTGDSKDRSSNTTNKVPCKIQIPLSQMLKQDVMTSPMIITANVIRKSITNFKARGEIDIQNSLRISIEEQFTVTDYLEQEAKELEQNKPKKKYKNNCTTTLLGCLGGAFAGQWGMKYMINKIDTMTDE